MESSAYVVKQWSVSLDGNTRDTLIKLDRHIIKN